MRLLSCHISGFGCLRDYELTFQEGITGITACNGFGKTTLAEFLRAMFYGFPKNTRDPEKSLRKKYRPWDGGIYGGSLRFSHGEKVYQLHRTFGDSPRQDRFLLMDEGTGTPSQDFSSQIGLELFGLDSDAFSRSTYFPQTPVSADAPGLLARLDALVEDAEDPQNFDRAIASLRSARAACVPYRGKGGTAGDAIEEISRLQIRIHDLTQQQRRLQDQQAELSGARQALKENQAAEKDLQDQLLRATRLSAQDTLFRQYQHLCQEIQKTEAALATLGQRYPHGLPSRLELSQVKEALKEQEAHGTGSKSPRNPLLSIFSIFFLLGGIVSAFISLFLATLLIAAGVVLGVFALVKRRPRKAAAPDPRLAAFSARYDIPVLTGSGLDGILEDLLSAEHLRCQLADRNTALTELCQNGVPEDPGEGPFSIGALETQLSACRQEIRCCSADIARLEQSCNLLQEQVGELPELRDRLARQQERKSRALKEAQLLDAAGAYLQKARSELSGRYMQTLRQRFCQYMALLLQVEPQDLFLGDDLQIRIHRGGEPRPATVLSRGQSDLTEFSMRLALADTLFPGEKPVLILDDPFVNLDRSGRKKVAELLKDLSAQYQILYLSCLEDDAFI